MKHELKGRAAAGSVYRAHSQRAQGVREEKLRAKKLHRTQNSRTVIRFDWVRTRTSCDGVGECE